MRPVGGLRAGFMSRSPRRQRGQSGMILAVVLVTLAMFSVITAALLGLTLTVLRVTEIHAQSAAKLRAADGGLEIVINRLRLDAGAIGEDCPGSGTHDGYASSYLVSISTGGGSMSDVVIECSTTLTGSPPRRVVSLTARPKPGLGPIGRARVRIDDFVGALPRPGRTLIVCDWQLGKAVASTLASCPTI